MFYVVNRGPRVSLWDLRRMAKLVLNSKSVFREMNSVNFSSCVDKQSGIKTEYGHVGDVPYAFREQLVG